MGLDMWLMRGKGIKKEREVLEDSNGAKHDFEYNKIIDEEEVMYWRKTNAIHDWFVKNVQDGEDDCGIYEVSIEKLKELKDTCKKVIDGTELADIGKREKVMVVNPDGELKTATEHVPEAIDSSVAEELLPTSSGFFFGSTNYDRWYLEDIKDTFKVLDELLKSDDLERYKYYYMSSW